MRIVFLGTSDFGEPALTALVKECYDVPGVFTQPDARCGRGMKAAPCAIKEAARKLNLPVFQPEDINSPGSVKLLASLKPDILLVVAYGQILSEEVLRVPAIMPLNIHGSLLPKYRGPAPVNAALLNGDEKTGNTLMKVVRKMDAGPVILQREEMILVDDDAVTLERKLSADSAGLLLEGLELIAAGKAPLREQDESAATYVHKLKKPDGLLDWSLDARTLRNRVRGLAGWPGTFTYYKGNPLKIFPPVSALEEGSGTQGTAHGRVPAFPVTPGTVIQISASGIRVACGRGSLAIDLVQPAGRRKMTGREFIAGHKISVGEKLGEGAPKKVA